MNKMSQLFELTAQLTGAVMFKILVAHLNWLTQSELSIAAGLSRLVRLSGVFRKGYTKKCRVCFFFFLRTAVRALHASLAGLLCSAACIRLRLCVRFDRKLEQNVATETAQLNRVEQYKDLEFLSSLRRSTFTETATIASYIGLASDPSDFVYQSFFTLSKPLFLLKAIHHSSP